MTNYNTFTSFFSSNFWIMNAPQHLPPSAQVNPAAFNTLFFFENLKQSEDGPVFADAEHYAILNLRKLIAGRQEIEEDLLRSKFRRLLKNHFFLISRKFFNVKPSNSFRTFSEVGGHARIFFCLDSHSRLRFKRRFLSKKLRRHPFRTREVFFNASTPFGYSSLPKVVIRDPSFFRFNTITHHSLRFESWERVWPEIFFSQFSNIRRGFTNRTNIPTSKDFFVKSLFSAYWRKCANRHEFVCVKSMPYVWRKSLLTPLTLLVSNYSVLFVYNLQHRPLSTKVSFTGYFNFFFAKMQAFLVNNKFTRFYAPHSIDSCSNLFVSITYSEAVNLMSQLMLSSTQFFEKSLIYLLRGFFSKSNASFNHSTSLSLGHNFQITRKLSLNAVLLTKNNLKTPKTIFYFWVRPISMFASQLFKLRYRFHNLVGYNEAIVSDSNRVTSNLFFFKLNSTRVNFSLLDWLPASSCDVKSGLGYIHTVLISRGLVTSNSSKKEALYLNRLASFDTLLGKFAGGEHADFFKVLNPRLFLRFGKKTRGLVNALSPRQKLLRKVERAVLHNNMFDTLSNQFLTAANPSYLLKEKLVSRTNTPPSRLLFNATSAMNLEPYALSTFFNYYTNAGWVGISTGQFVVQNYQFWFGLYFPQNTAEAIKVKDFLNSINVRFNAAYFQTSIELFLYCWKN